MHQLRSAHLLEALQESLVVNVGKEEAELFVEVFRFVDQSRKVKQGDGISCFAITKNRLCNIRARIVPVLQAPLYS